MGEEQSPLDQPWGIARFAKKVIISFVWVSGFLGAMGLFNDPIMNQIKEIAATPWGIFPILIMFTFAMLVSEFIGRYQRQKIESRRSQPIAVRRRAKVMAARQQRVHQRR